MSKIFVGMASKSIGKRSIRIPLSPAAARSLATKNLAQLSRSHAGLAVSTHRALRRGLGGEMVLKADPGG